MPEFEKTPPCSRRGSAAHAWCAFESGWFAGQAVQRARTRLHGCFWEISLGIGTGLWNDFFELRFSAFVISTTLERISPRAGPIMAHLSE
ncbi:hypothetical protein BCEP4_60111 [Burkholderia cepacia]|nr:hypothetical protein BCEP4_60111 [Burkholderia cepacia]